MRVFHYWYKVRDDLMKEFEEWCNKVRCPADAQNMIEYLGAMHYLKLKKIVDEIEDDDITQFSRWEPHKEPLREGFLPYNALCEGKRRKDE